MGFGDKLFVNPKPTRKSFHGFCAALSPFLFRFFLHERAAGLPEQVAGMEVIPGQRGTDC